MRRFLSSALSRGAAAPPATPAPAPGPLSPRFARISCTLLVALLLGSCASLTESQCRDSDWAAIGREDGLRGRPAAQLDKHRAACAGHGVQPDADTWRREHRQGLAAYCTAAGGYVAGRRGDSYEEVCAGAAERAFKPAFRDGHRVHDILRDLEELQRRMDDVERSALASGDLSPEARTQRRFESTELRRQYQQRQRDAERLDERYALKYKVDPLRDLDYRP